jgi:uncharacterized protein (TIGR02246 family)
MAKRTEDERAIIQQNQKFQSEWNKGNPDVIADFFTADAIRVGSVGEISKGRKEILEAYKMLLNRAMPGSNVNLQNGGVRFLCNDLALWEGEIEIELPGNSVPLRGYLVNIMKKENGNWLILESHPKIFLPEKQKVNHDKFYSLLHDNLL